MTSPTLSDVARAAGVSYATADRVINNRGNVAEKSIAKVREAVSALGYVRNVAAANLSRGRIYRLAFLIPRGSNAFFDRIRQHIQHAANHQATERVTAEVIEIAAFAVEGLQDSISDLLEHDLDGIAIVGLQSATLEAPLAALRAKGVAVVGLVSDLPQAARAAYIGIDNIAAGRTAARMVGLAHAGQGQACGVERRGQVDGDDGVPFISRELVNRGDMLNARVVNQDIAAPGLFNQRAAIVALGHIGANIAGRHTGFSGDLFRNGVILVAVGKTIEHDIRTGAGHFPSNAKPDTGI